MRELGGDVVEHVVRPGDAAAGALLRDLGLPRDALVSLIVRGDEVLLPRGSTRVEEGDRMHVLVAARGPRPAAADPRALADRPGRAPGPAAAHLHGLRPRLLRPPVERRRTATRRTRASSAASDVVEHLRTRRDVPGALVILGDGRYAVTGPLLMVGPPGQLQTQARRRLDAATDDAERSWWQEVIGACAQ